jgi:hypothetical protein
MQALAPYVRGDYPKRRCRDRRPRWLAAGAAMGRPHAVPPLRRDHVAGVSSRMGSFLAYGFGRFAQPGASGLHRDHVCISSIGRKTEN